MNIQKIKKVFIEKYKKNINKIDRKVGIECEFPVVYKQTGEAVDYKVIRNLFSVLQKEGWIP